MSRMVDPILAELGQEAAATRRLLDRVPSDKLEWKPHPKSMSLGELATHVATLPGTISGLLDEDSFDVSRADFKPATSTGSGTLLPAFEGAMTSALERLGSWDDAKAAANWKLSNKGTDVFTAPRIAAVRSLMLNHWYHHRGQLTVYLRLLDVALPATYGNSADENPIAP